MSYLLFNLIQNWNGEYSEKEPYMVIELVDQNHAPRGFSMCDELGRTDFLPGTFKKVWFLAANEDTELAFIGEKKYIDGKEVLVVKFDPECAIELDRVKMERLS